MKRRIPNVPVPDTRAQAVRDRVVHTVMFVRREGKLRKRTIGLPDEHVEALAEIARRAGSWQHGREWPKLVRLAVKLLVEAHEGEMS